MLYYRVDWSDAPAAADGSVPAGELVARKERLQKAQQLLPPAEADWRAARAAPSPLEKRRPVDQAWYVEELAKLRSNPKKTPLFEVKYDAGRTFPAATQGLTLEANPAVDRYGQPLLPRDVYNAQIAAKDAEVLDAFDRLMTSSERDTEWTLRLSLRDVPKLIQAVDAQIKVYEPKEDDDPGTKAFKTNLVNRLTEHKNQLEAIQGQTDFARGLEQRIQEEKTKLEGVVGTGGEMESVQDKASGKMVWKVKTLGKDGELALVQLAQGQVREESQILLGWNKRLKARIDELGKPAVTTVKP